MRIDPSEDKNNVRYIMLDAHAACGQGSINDDYPEVIRSIEMPIAVARRFIGRADSAVKIIQAMNDSMIPTINSKDLLFVDTSVTEFQGGEGVYLIFHGGGLLCKRLSFVGRVLTVLSDNAKYPPWPWEERFEDTRIIGRVLRALPLDFTDFGGDAAQSPEQDSKPTRSAR